MLPNFESALVNSLKIAVYITGNVIKNATTIGKKSDLTNTSNSKSTAMTGVVAKIVTRGLMAWAKLLLFVDKIAKPKASTKLKANDARLRKKVNAVSM